MARIFSLSLDLVGFQAKKKIIKMSGPICYRLLSVSFILMKFPRLLETLRQQKKNNKTEGKSNDKKIKVHNSQKCACYFRKSLEPRKAKMKIYHKGVYRSVIHELQRHVSLFPVDGLINFFHFRKHDEELKNCAPECAVLSRHYFRINY